MKSYLVGGAVRDQLLGLPVLERAWMVVVVGATPEELLAMRLEDGSRFHVDCDARRNGSR